MIQESLRLHPPAPKYDVINNRSRSYTVHDAGKSSTKITGNSGVGIKINVVIVIGGCKKLSVDGKTELFSTKPRATL